MRVHGRGQKQSALFEIGYNVLVRVLAERADKLFGRGKPSALVHRLNERELVLSADARVVLAERGRDMHDARAL